MKDHYEVLEVPPNASPEKIKEQYRFLIHAWHPDKFPNPTQKAKAEEKIKEINAAYEVVGDPLKRRQYDKEHFAQTQPWYPQEGTMSYQAEISRSNPTLFVFLLDQSGSMSAQFGGQPSGTSKANGVADAINRMLSNLVIRCSQGEIIRDYFEIAILGYGAQERQVAPALSGPLSGRDIVKISEIGNSPARVEDRVLKQPDVAGGVIDMSIKFPIWFESVVNGDTPMCQVLQRAHQLVGNWIRAHRGAFPPIVINLTDGEATDGDPFPYAQDLMKLSTDDGSILLFNCHLSSTVGERVLYPESAASIPDQYGKKMFEMSSMLTPTMVEFAKKQGFAVGEKSRGFVFQADLVDVIRFLDIGTRPKELR